ncbi:MAG: family 20 glycosylhydrolase [Planctomycetes bacterium]|nr:family 20 glycosylhydrolase [Planctomycetota bacterium]
MLRPLAVAAILLAPASVAQDLALVPWPRTVEHLGGAIRLPASGPGSATPVAIDGRIDPQLGPERYRLTIDRGVELVAGDARGLAWGRATLRQLAATAAPDHTVELPRLRIDDGPDLPYRGVLLDVARFWHDVDALRAAIDLLALHKVPFLHLHLSDDQSFTFPSRTLPAVPSVFPDGTRRHYTRDELTALVAHAIERGVTLVPEIDVPGHASLLGRAYPDRFGTVDPATGAARSTGVVNMANERAYAALDALLGELCDVFTDSPYLHFGADEVAAGGLLGVSEYRTYCEAHGLTNALAGDTDELYAHFIARMCELIRGHGRRPIVWEGFRGTGTPAAAIPRDLVVMAWSLDTNPPDRLAAAGFDVVNCGWWPLYLVPTQGRAPSAADAYAWHPREFGNRDSPLPVATFAPDVPLLGAQLCLWEQTPDVAIQLLRTRLPAIAERTWTPDRPRAFADFASRVERLAPLVDQVLADGPRPPPDTREPCYRYRFFPAPPRLGWDAMPDLAASTPARSGTLGRATPERIASINARLFARIEPFGHVDTRIPDAFEPYALELHGRVRVPTDGPHEFLLRSDDGLAELWLGGTRVAWRQHPGSPAHDVTRGDLRAGVHELTLRYFFRSIRNELNLRVRLPGAAEPIAFEELLLPLDAPPAELAPTPQPFVAATPPATASLATGRPVRCSGGTEGAMLPMLAVDGDPSNASGWHAHPYPQWLEVDLGDIHAIDRVRVVTYHDGHRAYRYTVEASADGATWTTVGDHRSAREPAGPAGIEDRFPPTPARFVRVDLLHNTANVGVHLNELAVWADAEARDRTPAGASLTVTPDAPVPQLPDGTAIHTLTFDASLSAATLVRAGSLRLDDGALVDYRRTPTPSNQTLAADRLQVDGTVTLRNDNAWTHDAHLLRIAAPLAGTGTVVIAGDADGGVELTADSSATFDGTIRVDGGMLVVRRPGALGAADTRVTLRGGKLFLAAVALPQALRVDADATLWLGGPVTLTGGIHLAAGATLTIDSGGGNPLTFAAPVTGAGTLRIAGAAGSTTPLRVAAGGTIAATVGVVLAGPDRVELALATDADCQLGAWSLATDCALRCRPDAPDRVALAAREPWTGALRIVGFDPDADRALLTAGTLPASGSAGVGFVAPRGRPAELYRAVVDPDGALRPGALVAPRDPPFATDPAADAARRSRYECQGLAALAAADSPLRAGDVVSCFGDSITWLGGVTGRIESAVLPLGVQVRNRGINGGGVADLRDGSPRSAREGGRTDADGDAAQAPFADVLRADRTAVAVVFIGINDVTWRGTPEPDFEAGLRELCRHSAEVGARTVLATPFLAGELPDGTNPHDPRIDRFAAIVRSVAAREGATLVDLRAASIAWLQNHNRTLRLDGTLAAAPRGLLTHDGIHPTATGDELVAQLLADGIRRALDRR